MSTTYLAGTQVTGTINQDERKIDIPNEILYLEPDVAPLVHISMGQGANGLPVKKKSCINPKFLMLEKQPFERWTAINNAGGYTAGDVTLTVDTTAMIPIGCILKSVTSNEQLHVTGKSPTTITVTRAFGATSAAALANNEPLKIVGSLKEENSSSGAAIGVKSRSRTNYCGIKRWPFGLSATLQNSELYGGKKRTDLRKEAWIECKKQIEDTFIFSEPYEDLTGGPSGYPIRSTGGIHYWLNAAGQVSTVATTLTLTIWLTFLRNLFRYGASKKVILAAPIIIDACQYWKNQVLVMKPNEEAYNLRAFTWETGHGTAYIVRDLALENAQYGDTTKGYGGLAIGIEPGNISYRYLQNRDIGLYEDILSGTGVDGWTDEYKGEIGIQVDLPETHRMLTGVEEYA